MRIKMLRTPANRPDRPEGAVCDVDAEEARQWLEHHPPLAVRHGDADHESVIEVETVPTQPPTQPPTPKGPPAKPAK